MSVDEQRPKSLSANSGMTILPRMTIARLTFPVPAERMPEFETLYVDQIAPIIVKLGLKESATKGRATTDDVFTRLFDLETPAEVIEKRERLRKDPSWRALLRDFENRFWQTPAASTGTGPGFPAAFPDGFSFEFYSTRTWTGQRFPGGRGKGHWRTHDGTDGPIAGAVTALLQDSRGFLWVWMDDVGVCRYDGGSFSPLEGLDHLVGTCVLVAYEDREGNVWFGSGGGGRQGSGVTRYDGRTFTRLTVEDGLIDNTVMPIIKDRVGDMWFGTEGAGVSRYDGERFTNITTKDGLAGNLVYSILEDRGGTMWFGTWGGGVSRLREDAWTTYTTENGLSSNCIHTCVEDSHGGLWFATENGLNCFDGRRFEFVGNAGAGEHVRSICEDRQGSIWIGTNGGGVNRIDADSSATKITTGDGLAHPSVTSIALDSEGHIWVGTAAGLSRFAGAAFTTFTTEDGLADDAITTMCLDAAGNHWLSCGSSGLSRYDGETFTTFAYSDQGPLPSSVTAMVQDRSGAMWFGTHRSGVCRYDGTTWENFRSEDGLTTFDPIDGIVKSVQCIYEDRDGGLWFGTWEMGVTCFDGSSFSTFTTSDGLVDNVVLDISQDRAGGLWFLTQRGLCRYDGKSFVPFSLDDVRLTSAPLEDRNGNLWFNTHDGVCRYNGGSYARFSSDDGLPHGVGKPMLQDSCGHLWFATSGGGVCRYDGRTFQTLTQQDGLAGNSVSAIVEDLEGSIWFATNRGLTRFCASAGSTPRVSIDAIVADRRYDAQADLELSTNAGIIAFEFHGASFKTRPEAMVYRHRLKSDDEPWLTSRDRRVEYPDVGPGPYVFEVQAVDRDLNYSEPAAVNLTVVADTRDARIDELEARVRARTRELEETHGELQRAQAQLIGELEAELQSAHEMQMGLMPTEAPQLEGFDVAGRCLPANHVGGDLFKYFVLPNNRVAGVLADVTGHAMEAAVPLMVFSGILESQMELGGSIEELFGRLNNSLFRTLSRRTFVCFTMAELNPQTGAFRVANCGCPYPYHYRAATGDIVELEVDAYPLGIKADSVYEAVDMQLEKGDRVVFCSDGIVEATDVGDLMFGFDRTRQSIRSGCEAGLSAQELLDQILVDVKTFSGEAAQGDDQTIVVLHVEDLTDIDNPNTSISLRGTK